MENQKMHRSKDTMEKKVTGGVDQSKKGRLAAKRLTKKMSEFGRQLYEKQKVKRIYGLREKQFSRFFKEAVRQEGAPGQNLLSMLERRLDNVVYRLKMAKSREQARQMVVHGHIRVNNQKVHSPSYLVSVHDVISLSEQALKKAAFLEAVVDKRMKVGIKVPDWIELDKKHRAGVILRNPVREDVQMPIEEHLIVELYSK